MDWIQTQHSASLQVVCIPWLNEAGCAGNVTKNRRTETKKSPYNPLKTLRILFETSAVVQLNLKAIGCVTSTARHMSLTLPKAKKLFNRPKWRPAGTRRAAASFNRECSEPAITSQTHGGRLGRRVADCFRWNALACAPYGTRRC